MKLSFWASDAKIEHPQFDGLGCVKHLFSRSMRPSALQTTNKAEHRAVVERLRAHFAEEPLAAMLGINRRRFAPSDKQGISQSAARLGYTILRMIESPHVPLSPLEIICLGKYGTFHDPAMVKPQQSEPPPSPEFEL